MKVTEDTKALAQQIDDYFLVHPERHNQAFWVAVDGMSYAVETRINEGNVCDTTMCIAGSAVYLTRSLEEFRKFIGDQNIWSHEAAELLGLNDTEADWLFYDSDNETAISGVRAIANGDVDKFTHLMEECYGKYAE